LKIFIVFKKSRFSTNPDGGNPFNSTGMLPRDFSSDYTEIIGILAKKIFPETPPVARNLIF
jgi:hypothetical protein